MYYNINKEKKKNTNPHNRTKDIAYFWGFDCKYCIVFKVEYNYIIGTTCVYKCNVNQPILSRFTLLKFLLIFDTNTRTSNLN